MIDFQYVVLIVLLVAVLVMCGVVSSQVSRVNLFIDNTKIYGIKSTVNEELVLAVRTYLDGQERRILRLEHTPKPPQRRPCTERPEDV